MSKRPSLADLPARLRKLAEGQSKGGGKWRIEDLPADERAELLAALAESDRGEGLPVEQALREVDRMVEEILATVGPRAAASK
ncbi:MAG: hypothetical protein JO347_03245 [Candidatus Eremiobacteraeota bacterium]|nr:hypothetical protein [Candidatus Eremiobacteraeota bacterium]